LNRRLLLMPLILMISALMGCQTIQPPNSTLKAMQEWATPEPPDRVSPPHEHTREKAAMVRWLEKRFKHEYRVVGQHFVFLEPGFTQGASIGSKAHQYVTYTLGGQVQTDDWFGDDNYRLVSWKFNDGRQRYLAFVMTREFLPGTNEQRLVGYLELAPSQETKVD
jgi:hypothetical protein